MSSVIRHPSSDRRAIILWLSLCLLLVASMVLIGGYTRLSGSGLSITSWKPIHGTLPPMNEAEWQEEFTAYQQSPQYQKVNQGMLLDEFKVIFWPEFIHRLLGRLVGAVFFLPLIVFWARRSMSARMAWRLVGIFALGGLQGLIGWLMVKSGLVDNPQVSPIRLAAHLSTAFAVFGLIEWTLLDISTPAKAGAQMDTGFRRYFYLWFILLCLQIILGAFMAGLHAGLTYNTWPTMNGQWIPDDLWSTSPWYANITLIQFLHRNVAHFLGISYLLAWFFIRKDLKNSEMQGIALMVAIMLIGQIVLGIITLFKQAPLELALAHQMTGLFVFATAVIFMHKIVSVRRTQ